ncbi:MAG: UDP-N-acetylglucosamine 2-epimerase (non-hydrolyzing) [Bacteroidales bacterium]|jgi:UDP-GlcNAc3NAcA epimerase|nr:UDP-N-acetylglucosamine 2-epimerase (non-hydrolyzing) [Bacteroidales bacterium]
MKILTIIGARPQFIKAAAVSREITKTDIKEIIVHTGQHFDSNMSDIFFEEMEIPKPNYNLAINSLSHGAMTGRMLEGIESIILKEKPDVLMVYGDTNSTIAGALAASKLGVKVAHIEAGLRSFNMEMPEEINRILTDRISNILFCPTDKAIENLQKEGFENYNCSVIKNGDVMQDAALFYEKKSSEKSNIIIKNKLEKSRFVLSTIHRQENTDKPGNLESIIEGLNKINTNTKVVMPLHPRTKKILEQRNIKVDFKIIPPVGYFDMIELLKNCELVVTDSGGLQKEAFFFKKLCITAREQTEWTELIDNNYNVLVGANGEKLFEQYNKLKTVKSDFEKNLYGNGIASSIIVKELQKIIS